MFGVALLTGALLALADARIYERCELARDLLSLGIKKEHLSTWICIAFHESRFDTAARNPYSGDHGLLQISELYWCGAGKACGLPCSALRDEDISDDVECALRVHEEHTRLQGNGFLAWVVYPQHCKHNTKKYLADCESSVKTPTVRTDGRARILKPQNNNFTTTFSYNPKIDELLPPYLTVGSFLRGSYEKEFEQNYNNKVRINWLNYKIDNIDDLKLPVFNQKVTVEYSTTALTPSSTTTQSPLPKVKPPSPRRIESNSFRRRNLRPTFEPVQFIETTRSPMTTSTLQTTTTPRNIYSSTSENILKDDKSFSSAVTNTVQTTSTTTTTTTTANRPVTKDIEISTAFNMVPSVAAQTTLQTTKSPLLHTTRSTLTTAAQDSYTKTIYKAPTTKSTVNQDSTKVMNISLPSDKTRSINDFLSSSSTAPPVTTKSSYTYGQYTTLSTTRKPQTKSWLTWRTTPYYKTTITSTTPKPTPVTWWTTKSWSSTIAQKKENITSSDSKNQPTTSNPWKRSRVWPETKSLQTIVPRSDNNITSSSTFFTLTTPKPRVTTTTTNIRSSRLEPKSTSRALTSTELPSPTISKNTQSIFDLYLNPTKRPDPPAFRTPFFKNRGVSLRIFAGGTTTHAPSFLKNDNPKSA